jgi:DNA-binding HxlR family transcriptional regulator
MDGNPEECERARQAVEGAFGLLGKRWNGLILVVLIFAGRAGFAELRRAIPGISERILSDRLSELAEAGLVLRTVREGPPLGVSYELTERGKALEPVMMALRAWGEKYPVASEGAKD